MEPLPQLSGGNASAVASVPQFGFLQQPWMSKHTLTRQKRGTGPRGTRQRPSPTHGRHGAGGTAGSGAAPCLVSRLRSPRLRTARTGAAPSVPVSSPAPKLPFLLRNSPGAGSAPTQDIRCQGTARSALKCSGTPPSKPFKCWESWSFFQFSPWNWGNRGCLPQFKQIQWQIKGFSPSI